jgi:hypothetical protein
MDGRAVWVVEANVRTALWCTVGVQGGVPMSVHARQGNRSAGPVCCCRKAVRKGKRQEDMMARN